MLKAVPDRRRQPSDGLVVEASIVARLLRIRLLKLDATVVIVPADVTAPPAVVPHESRRPVRSQIIDMEPPRPVPVGGVLGEAVQRINEAATIRAEARRRIAPPSSF